MYFSWNSLKSLNRTSVGLKHKASAASLIPRTTPQSNQRGIETRVGIPARLGAPGLNRTSVGLKLDHDEEALPQYLEPQSNQRGIETGLPAPQFQICPLPQSNQRGIETNPDPTILRANWPGLNRTSVGLKPWKLLEPLRDDPLPQSNQRGIETGNRIVIRITRPGCLNRTSVGLKRKGLTTGERRV